MNDRLRVSADETSSLAVNLGAALLVDAEDAGAVELDRVDLGDAAGLLGRVERCVAERDRAQDARRAGLAGLVAGLAGARRLVAVDAVRHLRAGVDRADGVTRAAAEE